MKFHIKRHGDERIFRKFLISYLAILLVPILIFGILYAVIFGDYKKEVRNTNSAIIDQLYTVSDSKLSVVNTLVQRITLNPYFREVMSLQSPFSMEDKTTMQRFIKDLAYSVPLDEGLVEDYYIYLPDTQNVVGTESVMAARLFYPYACNYQGVSYDDWQHVMQVPRSSFYYESHQTSSAGSLAQTVMVVAQPLPVENKLENLPKLILHLNPDFLQSLVYQDAETTSSNTVLITDSSGSVLFSSGPVDPEAAKLSTADEGTLKLDQGRYTYTKAPTVIHGWEYLVLTETGGMDDKLTFVRIITAVSMLLVAIFGYFLALAFSRSHYRPINDILQIFNTRAGKATATENSHNEYEMIRENIAGVLSETESLKTEIGKQQPIIKSHIYHKYLTGTLPGDQMQQALEDLVYQYYNVLYCEIDLRESDSFSLRTVILQRIEEGKAENEWIVSMNRNHFCAFVGYNQLVQNDTEDIIGRIHAVAQSLNLPITIAVSEIVHGATEIPKAYAQAQKAIEHKLIKGIGSVIYSQEITDDEQKEGYYYPADKEIQFINCIKISDMDKAMGILNEIIEENFHKRNLSVEMASCVVFNIISTINKVLWDVKLDVNHVFDQNPVITLAKCQSVQEIHECVNSVLETLQKHLQDYKVNRNEELKERVLKYIQQNYHDNNMSLTMVAEEMNINSSYLSRYFKEQFDENFIDYLSGYRVDVAKKLLEETDFKIKDIALAVGYTSANNFIRVFKKLEGISPSKFREKIMMERKI